MDQKNTFSKKKIILFVILAIAIIAVFSAGTVLLFNIIANSGNRVTETEETEITTEVTTERDEREDLDKRTTFAIYGVDKNEALADVIIVGVFDREKEVINTISVPRDTFVVMPDDRLAKLKEKGLWAPSDGMKINAVHSYAGDEGNEYLTEQLNELLDVDIEYYFEVNLDAFTEIVDAAGGIEIDVPSRMYYRDPTQGLYINIKPGLQVLDGETAQGFVRFRQYITGDIHRIEMQQLFLKEFFKQVFDKESIKDNFVDYVKIFFANVKTNMRLRDALKYISLVDDIPNYDINMEILPGDGHTPYMHYEEETKKMVDRLFKGKIVVEETTSEEMTAEDMTEEETTDE